MVHSSVTDSPSTKVALSEWGVGGRFWPKGADDDGAFVFDDEEDEDDEDDDGGGFGGAAGFEGGGFPAGGSGGVFESLGLDEFGTFSLKADESYVFPLLR